jgi:hypothetical protein
MTWYWTRCLPEAASTYLGQQEALHRRLSSGPLEGLAAPGAELSGWYSVIVTMTCVSGQIPGLKVLVMLG